MGDASGVDLYVGVTNDLMKRVEEHISGAHDGFTAQRGVTRLLFFEEHNYIKNAIKREKQLKAGSRAQKIGLAEAFNPSWDDLSAAWFKYLK
jgi:putative endonuclease